MLKKMTNTLFCFVLFCASATFSFDSPNDLQLKVYEVDESNTVQQVLASDPNTEVVLERIARIRLECQSPFPVQWVYQGNGVPALSSTIRKDTETKFYASAFIPTLKEAHTGQYSCISTASPQISAYFWLYVPGPNIFPVEVNPEIRRKIQIFKNSNKVTLPCGVSHPGITVVLEKVLSGDVLVAIKSVGTVPAYRFNPRNGFELDPTQLADPTGTYACTGFGRGSKKTVEFDVTFDEDRYTQQENYGVASAPPVPMSEENRCGSHNDCPPNWACYTDRVCRDPCTYSIRCGVQAICKTLDRRPYCECPKDFVGDPMKQCFNSVQSSDPRDRFPEPMTTTRSPEILQCKVDGHCELSSQVCVNGRCLDACAVKSCDRNAFCVTGSDRVAKCICNQGFSQSTEDSCTAERFQVEPKAVESCRTNQDCPADSICRTNVNGTYCSMMCKSRFCGNQAVCRGTCVCATGLVGDPFDGCYEPHSKLSAGNRCASNTDCGDRQKCITLSGSVQQCIEPCLSHRCPFNTECRTRAHQPECLCPTGFTGSTIIGCTKIDDAGAAFSFRQRGTGRDLQLPDNLQITKVTQPPPASCAELDCGPNSECRIDKDGRSECICLKYFVGEPPKCRECTFNIECPEDHICLQNRCACKSPEHCI